MSVIAVTNLPSTLNMQKIVRTLAYIIKGDFEALSCVVHGKFKTAYIQLSERLDPQFVVEVLKKKSKFNAYVPKHVPDLKPSKYGKIPLKLRKKLGISEFRPVQVFMWTNVAIVAEMQSKFTGLFNLSRKTGNRLLDNIARKVMERLKLIHASNPEVFDKCFRLSSYYRRVHPHFGDFQLILDTLHALQDEAKVPRAQLVESDLTVVECRPFVLDSVPHKVIQQACKTYSDKIVNKIMEHVEKLNAETSETDSAEEIARKRVRRELKNISPYLPQIIKQVIGTHFSPEKSPHHRFTIHGEPFLPPKSVMSPFLAKFSVSNIVRSDRMYNLLRCNIRIDQVTDFMKLDGTVLNDAKLVIRPTDTPTYKIPDSIMDEIRVFFGNPVVEFNYPDHGDIEADADADEADDDEAVE